MAAPGTFSGDIAVMSAADVIVWLANRGRSGTLFLSQGVVQKAFEIDRGNATRVVSNSPRDDLGQFLINFGLATSGAIEAARRTVGETNIRLGRVLALAQVVSESDVRRVVEHQIREALLDTVRWDSGRFELHADARQAAKAEVTVSVPLQAVHRMAAARAPHWAAFHQAFPRIDVRLKVEESAVPPEPDPMRDHILDIVRRGGSVETVLQQTLLMEYEIYSRLYDMVRAGLLISLDLPVPPLSTSGGDLPFEVIVEAPEEAAPFEPARPSSAPPPSALATPTPATQTPPLRAPAAHAPPPSVPPPPPHTPPPIAPEPAALKSPRLTSDLIPPPVPMPLPYRPPFGGRTPLPAHAAAIPLGAPASSGRPTPPAAPLRMPNWPTPPHGAVLTARPTAPSANAVGPLSASAGHTPTSTASPGVPQTSRTPPPGSASPPHVSSSASVHSIPYLRSPLDEALRVLSSPRVRYILRRIDGARTIAEIQSMVPMTDREVFDVLDELQSAGFIAIP